MSYKLKLPNITGTTEKEQLTQMRNYLYQLVGDIQYALNDLEKASSNTKQTEENNNER